MTGDARKSQSAATQPGTVVNIQGGSRSASSLGVLFSFFPSLYPVIREFSVTDRARDEYPSFVNDFVPSGAVRPQDDIFREERGTAVSHPLPQPELVEEPLSWNNALVLADPKLLADRRFHRLSFASHSPLTRKFTASRT
jgi:hypothetical protein